MFSRISEFQTKKYEENLNRLEKYFTNADIKELVKYIVDYGSNQSYSTCKSEDDEIAKQIIQFIWEISKIDLSNISNPYHFELNWTSELRSFIGNYILDDFAFDFKINDGGFFTFSHAKDDGRWLQNPRILIEAAKINVLVNKKDPKEKINYDAIFSLIKKGRCNE